MMRTHVAVCAIFVLLTGCSGGPQETAPAQTPSGAAKAPQPDAARFYDFSWASAPLWDDGLAEVALYDARRPQYGKIVSYQALMIVVKEDLNRQLNVKADPPYDGKQLLPVLKLNAVHSYWTDRYPYNFMASVFARRDNPAALVKLTLGSQEWCGNTFKEITTGGPQPALVTHSYFDGEGDSTQPLDLREGDLLEDQLPLALRSLGFDAELVFERRLLPSLISNKLGGLVRFVQAEFRVRPEETIAAGIGRIPAFKIDVAWENVRQSWWFEKAQPRILLKMESSDGRAWLLRARDRKAYWKEPTFRPSDGRR